VCVFSTQPSDRCCVYGIFCMCVCVSCMSLCVCVCASMSDNTAVCEFAASGNSSVKCLAYSAVNCSVYVVLSSGRMVVCNADVTSSRCAVRTECHGNGRPIHCIAVRTLDSGFACCLLLRQFLLYGIHLSHRNSRANVDTRIRD